MDSLKFIMHLNATGCTSFGILVTSIPQVIAAFLGTVPKTVIVGLGIGFLAMGSFFKELRLQVLNSMMK